jgi:hypothetical protein
VPKGDLSLYRVVPVDPRARRGQPGHPLYVPRELQGAGRHDNPELYGCLYAALEATTAVAETLAPFRGTGRFDPRMLERGGRRLVLCELALDARAELLDLDDPRTLVGERLRPSQVATGRRVVTQRIAGELFRRYPNAAGLRWWSTIEASWTCVTLFDRALAQVRVVRRLPLDPDLEVVREACDALALTR